MDYAHELLALAVKHSSSPINHDADHSYRAARKILRAHYNNESITAAQARDKVLDLARHESDLEKDSESDLLIIKIEAAYKNPLEFVAMHANFWAMDERVQLPRGQQ